MRKIAYKLTAIICLVLVFQLSFPQYSHAYGLNSDELSREESILMLKNSPQPVLVAGVGGSKAGLPLAQNKKPTRVVTVPATAYTSTVEECDSDPFTTANGTQVHDGVIAANFLPFKTKVKIPKLYGDKVFVVEDRMNSRYSKRIDIWMSNHDEAIKFGLRNVEVEIFE